MVGRDFGYDEEEGGYPTATIPPMLYTSPVLFKKQLRWLQWPVKYRLLTTGHALTGRACMRLMISVEFIWCYDAIFSVLTRTSQPPGPVGTPLDPNGDGAVGIFVLNNADGKLFDPSGMMCAVCVILHFSLHICPRRCLPL